ncbi:4Fe-4S binding domain-containing protein [Lutibacter oricola]|uniref:4Fe-4S binding domain-containing protein n=1 Tax=Lutibacter oricola TaxID=762486 RepID=A0A1H2WW52_9FLAO|nr:4Fe-4S binding protein [Lutibacter oricola]SDW84860.1 4Fe-4S binding domain-containing protein [Lutibacter oricola]
MFNKVNRKKLETRLVIIAIVLIIAAWFTGLQLEDANVLVSIKEQIPEIEKLEEIDNASYKIFNKENELLGYVTLESSMGYGGPLLMCVAVGLNGEIINLVVINSKETPSYLEKVMDADFLANIIGRKYDEEYAIGNGVDAVSSATYSSRAMLEASKKGNRFIASKVLGFDVPKEITHSVDFGAAEIVLILLFAVGYFAHKNTFKYKKVARWGTMLVGLFVIGFYYNQPFTLSMFNQLLLGYFPPLHSHLYWYLLLGGIFLVFTIDNKNPYCSWFCPFGAAQDCIGQVTGAKHRSVGKYKDVLKWTLRILVLLAIVVALLLRNPGVTSYEVFGTLFKLTGSNLQFAILGIVIVASMFIKRPWCNYLCPIGPVTDNFTAIRKLILNKWKSRKASA